MYNEHHAPLESYKNDMYIFYWDQCSVRLSTLYNFEGMLEHLHHGNIILDVFKIYNQFIFIIQSPRQDLVESIRSAIALEYDNNLRAERSKWERQMVQLRDDHEQALDEIKSKHKLRDSAEQQVLFNEALAKLKDSNTDKDKEIKKLESSLNMKCKGMKR